MPRAHGTDLTPTACRESLGATWVQTCGLHGRGSRDVCVLSHLGCSALSWPPFGAKTLTNSTPRLLAELTARRCLFRRLSCISVRICLRSEQWNENQKGSPTMGLARKCATLFWALSVKTAMSPAGRGLSAWAENGKAMEKTYEPVVHLCWVQMWALLGVCLFYFAWIVLAALFGYWNMTHWNAEQLQ